MFRLWRLLLVLTLVAAATVGVVIYVNQDTYRDVHTRHADRFNAIRQAFLAVSKAMPPAGQIHETGCSGVPAGQHLFDYPDPRLERVVGNTVVLSQEQLANFANEPPDRFDIAPGSTLRSMIERSDPAYQPTEHDYEWADDGYAEFVDALSRTQYVVATRVFAINPGSATRTTFTGGSMNVEAVIADLRSHAILCTVSTKAILTAEELEYRFSEGAGEDTQSRNAQAAVEGALQGTRRLCWRKS